MRLRSVLRLVALLPLLLAACGDLPEPFLGNPGARARILAMPVAPMLAVAPGSDSLLDGNVRRAFAESLAGKLQNEEILAEVRTPGKADWRLAITAKQVGDNVLPRYAVLDPTGREQGAIDGATFPAAGWATGWPATLGQAVDDAVPKIVALITTIRRARDRADPNSLLNRVARLYVPDVKGAPGDGNAQLTRLIRDRLKEFGSLIQSTSDNPDFTIKGEVVMTPTPNGQQRVEITWTVLRPSGVVSGKVSQLNSIPAGTLDQYWGEVADAVTREASGGIETVVERFIGRDPTQPAK